jgi:hypothetical protein
MSFFIIPILTAFFAWFIAWFFVKAIFLNWNQQWIRQIQNMDFGKLLNATTLDAQFEATLPIIENQLDHFFKHKLKEKMPMIAMFIGDQTVLQLKLVFVEELRLIYPAILGDLAKGMQAQLAQNMQNRWRPILEPLLLKSTKTYRQFAFLLGFAWGVLLVLLIQHF